MYLQRFAEEREEQATPRRRQEARQRGQVHKSAELTAALGLLGVWLVIRAAAQPAAQRLGQFAVETLGNLPSNDLTVASAQQWFASSASLSATVLAPLFGSAVAIGIAATLLQTGWAFSVAPLAPQMARLNPGEGLKRIFSRRSAFDSLKAMAKLAAVSWLVWLSLKSRWDDMPALAAMPIGQATSFVGQLLSTTILRVGLAMLALAALDWLYGRWEYEKSLRMTKQEIKEEMRETEGDPRIRSRLRERQRALARRRMINDVRRADVVITNPTHYAVALKYDAPTMAAPTVLAKGRDFLAERIKEAARQSGVPLVENQPLAQSLYRLTEPGDQIPQELYQAVAEVLAFVYRQTGRSLR